MGDLHNLWEIMSPREIAKASLELRKAEKEAIEIPYHLKSLYALWGEPKTEQGREERLRHITVKRESE